MKFKKILLTAFLTTAIPVISIVSPMTGYAEETDQTKQNDQINQTEQIDSKESSDNLTSDGKTTDTKNNKGTTDNIKKDNKTDKKKEIDSDTKNKTIPVTKVTLDITKAELTVDETLQLTAVVTPSNATDKSLIWSISDKTIAKVDDTGMITALKAGKVNVTVKTKSGGKTAVCKVTVKEKNGWYKEDGAFKYYKDGKAYTGWHRMGKAEGESQEHWSYFDKDGKIYTGWHKMNKKQGEKVPHWSFFGNNGWLVTGWKYMDGSTGEKTPHWSYFGNNGWLVTGWKYMDRSTGEKTPHWSYFGSNGWLATGWQWMDQSKGEKTAHWSYFGGNGWLNTGTGKINGMTCTFNGSGWLRKYETLTPHFSQYKFGYPTGCAGTSMFMALRYKGKLTTWNLKKFMGTMPYSSNGDPTKGFVGNPTNKRITPSNRGIYPSALAKWGAKYGDVTDISGKNMSFLMDEVRKGNPVIALATWNLVNYPITQYSWGKFRDFNHHYFLLVGYDYNTDRYKVMDALMTSGNGSKWVSGTAFRNVWNGIKGAVVVR